MRDSLRDKVAVAFEQQYGTEAQGIAFAPGRVNLIGEHVDYHDGLVMPMPIREGTAVAWDRGGKPGTVTVRAEDFGETDSFAPGCIEMPGGWRSYCRGMLAMIDANASGLRLAIAGDLPRGTGLSSSASVCVAVGRAATLACAAKADPVVLARTAQEVEHRFVGVRCGIMDQMAVAAGEAGKAMLLDCRNLSFETVPIPADWHVLVIQSGVERGLVDGEYNARRSECAEAARLLGVDVLRDATLEGVEHADLPVLLERRARHVIEEIERVRSARQAILSGDLPWFGRILAEGHESLRTLFDTSVPQVDALVGSINACFSSHGGARMTGGGFGGAIVAVCDTEGMMRLQAELDRPCFEAR